jgi:hypothetical protein
VGIPLSQCILSLNAFLVSLFLYLYSSTPIPLLLGAQREGVQIEEGAKKKKERRRKRSEEEKGADFVINIR